jgi:hypothetical protein
MSEQMTFASVPVLSASKVDRENCGGHGIGTFEH